MSAENKESKSVMGRVLTALRKQHKLTQEQVSDILKIKRSTYAYYERDITPTLDIIKKLSTLFNVSVHFLLYGEEDPRSEVIGQLCQSDEKGGIPLQTLTKEESALIAEYRLLSPQLKAKIYKDVKELVEKIE
ncbi:MAG: helix-turn-helix transcriptional regulator [Acutalibacteraceae bacterium]|nr:helix-turn-helix transcriptional regulator [Acutalibacteraceae bacterium]